MTLKEIREKLEAKQTALADIFEKAKVKGNGQYDFESLEDRFFGQSKTTKEKLEKVHQAEAELNDLVDEAEKLSKAEKDWAGVSDRLKEPVSEKKIVHPVEPEFKTLGDLVCDKDYEAWAKSGARGDKTFNFKDQLPSDILAKSFGLNNIQTKTIMTTTAGWAPESLRIGAFVEAVTRPIQLLDIIPINPTSFEKVVYMEETTRTHSAAEKAEGGTFAESAFAVTEKESNVRKITDSLPVTDEQLEDVPAVNGYINGRVLFGLRQRLDTQVLIGNGTAPNLRGIKNVVGILTQAKGADPTPDAVFKLMRQIRVTGRALPTHIVMHPEDWEQIRLLRTADGVYIWGNPSEAGPERMWGLPVIQSDIDSAGTGYVGSFQPQWISLFEKRGIDVQIGFTGTQFVEGKRTIRADMRFAFVVFRPSAFGTVTGI